MAEESVDLEVELDRLYALPAGEFVAWRNQLAKRLRQAGDHDTADRVKKLPRPSQTAWAVNQLALRASAELEGLRVAGERVRAAHLAGRSEQQAAAKARRDAIATLRVIAEVALQEVGVAPTRIHRQRITQTLEVLSSRAAPGERAEAGEPRPGRLSIDLEPAGFDALADLAAALAAAQKAHPRPAQPKPRPVSKAGPPKVVEHPTSKRNAEVEARQAAARAAERRELDRRQAEARAKLERLEEKVEGLRQAAEDAVSGLDEAKRAEADLARAAREAEGLAREARTRADAAVTVTAQARQTSESAAAAQRRAEGEIAQARRELVRIEDAGK